MTNAIRHALVALPLGLILAGCSHSTKSSVSTASSAPPSGAVPDGRTSAITGEPNSSSTVHLTELQGEPIAPPVYPSVDIEELSQHVKNNSAVIIDARSPKRFAEGHVRGAINIPAGEKESYTEQYLRNRDPGQLIIIYCSSTTCHASDLLYEYLLSQGFTNLRLFSPGWAAIAPAKHLR